MTPPGPFHFEAATRLPPEVCFGTSSWTYPGWQGLVYHHEYKNEKDLRARCLAEYGNFPWFRAVGIDSSFYSPLSRKVLENYASTLPEHISWVSKVWEEITIPRYAKHARYGTKAGTLNPNFLNADIFCKRILPAYDVSSAVRKRTGPFVFEFQRMGTEFTAGSPSFLERLSVFLGQLPKVFQYSIELRNKDLLCAEYFDVINTHGVTHCFNHWSYMPRLLEQMKVAADSGGIAAPFYVARILTPLGLNYEKAVDRFQPYDRLQEPLMDMRDDVVRLAKRAIEKKIKVYVLVNNRAEGNAPLTIDAIGQKIVEGTR